MASMPSAYASTGSQKLRHQQQARKNLSPSRRRGKLNNAERHFNEDIFEMGLGRGCNVEDDDGSDGS